MYILSVTTVVGSVGAGVVTQLISSSGQSCTPLHHNVVLMQMLLVGHKVVFSSHGWQMQAQLLVTMLRRPYKLFFK